MVAAMKKLALFLTLAAQWFPQDPAALNRLLDECFRTATERTGAAPPRPRLLALVAPHAGLEYSGGVAAAAWARLGHPNNVILLAFNHQRRVQGVVAPDLDHYTTPIGTIPVNRQALKSLAFPLAPDRELSDHALTNQLPFLARVAPGVPVIPLYVGELDETALASAAVRLAGRLKQGDVIVVSSDFTHYGQAYGYTPFPADGLLPARLRQRARELFDRIGSLDIPQFDRYVSETRDNTCGWGPIRLLMAALARWNEEIYLSPLDYLASGELSHDYSLSVGYGALAFYPASAYGASEANRKKLLASARQTLDRYLKTGRKEPLPVPAAGRDAELEQPAAAFVTLRKHGELRGCIGTFSPSMPLWQVVPDRTLAAAGEDPRFPPLKAAEGPVEIEISLLTPLKRLASWRDFRLGHGALLVLGAESGTLLPQVAAEMHWNRDQFLENLALKAGLEPKAYRDPRAVLYTYAAQIFAESR